MRPAIALGCLALDPRAVYREECELGRDEERCSGDEAGNPEQSENSFYRVTLRATVQSLSRTPPEIW